MTEDYRDLETELSKLKPAEPSAELESRIFAVFDGAPEADRTDRIASLPPVAADSVIHWFRPIAAAAAVLAVFLGALILLRGTFDRDDAPDVVDTKSGETSDLQLQPVKAGNVFQGATDEGVIFNEDNEPQRSLRYRYHDRYQWVDESGARFELLVPNERRLLVPMQTD